MNDPLQETRPVRRDNKTQKVVFNALRRSGLTKDQTLDAIQELQQAGIIFGELHMSNGA